MPQTRRARRDVELSATLITGAAGFIGSHLAESLLRDGFPVVGIDNFDPFYAEGTKRRNLKGSLAHAGYHFEALDILDETSVERVMRERGVRKVVHLAARAGVRPSVENPQGYVQTNVVGTAALLRAAERVGIEGLVFASSSSVYGARAAVPFREEETTDHPASPYAATKKAGEVWLHSHHHLTGLPVTCLRFFTVYGPRQRPDLAIHRFVDTIESGSAITLFGDGSSSRDYTFVSDTVSGIRAALDRLDGYHIYNLGRSDPVSLLEMVQAIEGALDRKASIRWAPEQPGDVPRTCADVSKARRELGYDPTVTFREGIERFVTWFREERA